jgi:acetate kinase
LPGILHGAIFDTAFHASIPDYAYIYPLPYEWYEKHGIRRYGFHGPSHLYLSRRVAALLDKPAGACNLITIQLDRGVSLCAIREGRSIDTSMGLTPLEGAVMETRSGDIDPGIHAYVMQRMNLSAREMEQILNYKSGLCGITGRGAGRHAYLEAFMDGDPRCKLALEIETSRIRKYIGSYLAITGPLDGIVFSTGTGALEWVVREMVLDGLQGCGIRLDRERNRTLSPELSEAEITGVNSAVRLFVIPTNEELVYAEDVAAIDAGVCPDHQHHSYSFAQRGFVPQGTTACEVPG